VTSTAPHQTKRAQSKATPRNSSVSGTQDTVDPVEQYWLHQAGLSGTANSRPCGGVVAETLLQDAAAESPCRFPLAGTATAPHPDVMLRLAQSAASRAQARMQNGNVVHGALARFYPHLVRYYVGQDRDACARIDWHKCSPEDLWNVLRSKHLSSSKQNSMALSFRECMKKMTADDACSSEHKTTFQKHLDETNDKHLAPIPNLKEHFVEALSEKNFLIRVQKCMVKYHGSKDIKIKDGLFPNFTDKQCNMVRIALFMVSACTQQILHAIANPDQSRTAMDNAETRVVQARTELYQAFTNIVNSDAAPDMSVVDMTDFNGIRVDCTNLLGGHMSMLDVVTVMRELKREVGKHMRHFTESGELAERGR